MRGSSGADIQVDDSIALKFGGPRVVEQGRWLLAHGRMTRALPRVLNVMDDGYMMERLDDVVFLDEVNTLEGYGKLLAALREVWAVPHQQPWGPVSFDMAAHLQRMEPLIPASRVTPLQTQIMLRALGHIDWRSLDWATTHGDPIIDNVMKRDGQFVLIDPIPATPAIPDVKASDLGRVLQSVLGYEKYRYGFDYELLDPLEWIDQHVAVGMKSSWTQANEMFATVYFAVFHLMRSTVYVTNKIAMDIHEHCITPGIDLLDHYHTSYLAACLEDPEKANARS